MDPIGIAPILTPHGRILLADPGQGPALDAKAALRLTEAFERGSGHGLLQLGAGEVGTVLAPSLAYWRDFGARFVTAVCTQPAIEERQGQATVSPPPADELERLAGSVPPMMGGEYLTREVLGALWEETGRAFLAEWSASRESVQDFLRRRNPAWNVVGRVHFNLAENKRDEEAPFAFLATYTPRLSAQARAQHVPLGQALREYAGAQNKERLLALLVPVQRAAGQCPWLKAMVDAGEIFHPLRWTPQDAFTFLTDIPRLESAGVMVRVPALWQANRPPRPRVTAKVGTAAPSRMGMDALLDFKMEVTLDGERLTPAEIARLLEGSEGLALIRGRWVEAHPDKLRRMLDRFGQVEQAAAEGGLTFAEAMRMHSGAEVSGPSGATMADPDWSRVVAGPWLAETLQALRSPDSLAGVDPGDRLKATLRPYQQEGLRWLYLLSQLGLGACLADDMGLGKTIQVLALLLVLRAHKEAAAGPCLAVAPTSERLREEAAAHAGRPSLLVAPASLLANWAAESKRFAPALETAIVHPSAMAAEELKALGPERVAKLDLVITSYGSLLRLPWLTQAPWRLAILDEAQAIKNPNAKQTRAVKEIQARVKIALTGTPVENRLGDLWSIFDFLNPGLLGSATEFTAFTKSLAKRPDNPYAPLRKLVRPYILRRMKTDKAVIADLPDKIEMDAYCQLSRRQVALYRQAVQDLAKRIEETDGIQRRGIVLSSLMRLKQICNHPSQWLGDGSWAEEDSGKWARLREIAEVVAAKQEKALVFTQFREVTAPLSTFLGTVFGRPGLVLHGETPVKQRNALVSRFQEDEAVPFFVLSLKAGGSGLNLTAATHVIHLDRWWNPAVENQATDRAFRIGQTRTVLVHKLVCRGTVEEKIAEMIEAKRGMSKDVLEGAEDLLLTEMKNEELLRLVALDIHAAQTEG